MIVTQSRYVWAASRAAAMFGNKVYADAARHGFDFLRNSMWDAKNGGFYQMRDARGQVCDYLGFFDEKRTYGNAFGIYGLAALYELTKEPKVLDFAEALAARVVAHVAELDRRTGNISLYRELEVVDEVEDSATQISVADARDRNPVAEPGDHILEPLPPIDLGRIAAGRSGLGVIAVAALVAVISTMAGLLLAAAASWGHDTFAVVLRRGASQDLVVLAGRLAVVGPAPVAATIALQLEPTSLSALFPSAVATMVTWAFAVAGSALTAALAKAAPRTHSAGQKSASSEHPAAGASAHSGEPPSERAKALAGGQKSTSKATDAAAADQPAALALGVTGVAGLRGGAAPVRNPWRRADPRSRRGVGRVRGRHHCRQPVEAATQAEHHEDVTRGVGAGERVARRREVAGQAAAILASLAPDVADPARRLAAITASTAAVATKTAPVAPSSWSLSSQVRCATDQARVFVGGRSSWRSRNFDSRWRALRRSATASSRARTRFRSHLDFYLGELGSEALGRRPRRLPTPPR